jgi:NADH dehydrogenase
VILGAGFGGLRTALRLHKLLKNRPDYKIILIDKNTYQTYTPSLYEISTAFGGGRTGEDYSPGQFAEEVVGSASFLLNDVLKNKNIDTVIDEVTDINLSVGAVYLKSQDAIKYDYLVVAMGAETAFYNVEGAKTCCHEFKTLLEALRIRKQIKDVFEKAAQGEIKEINIIAIGGGFSGFEVIAEIAKYCQHLLKNNLLENSLRVNLMLIESTGKILKEAPVSVRRLAKKRLKKLGVRAITNSHVVKVEPHQITCEEGRVLAADVSVWTGGVQGHSLFKRVQNMALHDVNKRILVDRYLRIPLTKDAFAIGDSAYFEKDGTAVPATAWAAEQQADTVSENVWRAINNEPFLEYKPKFPGFVSSAGGKYGIAHLFGVTFSGFSAWLVKRLIDLKHLFGIYSPARALAIWIKQWKLWTRND